MSFPLADAAVTPLLPPRIDLRSTLPPVGDQGRRATCVAFAVTAAHEEARAAVMGLWEDLAEEVLHWGCAEVGGGAIDGTDFATAAIALARWGQPPEQFWPYDGARDEQSATYRPPAHALDRAHCYSARLRAIDSAVATVKGSLARGEPVLLGLWLSRAFATPSGGQIALPASEDELEGGHALLAVGYDDTLGESDGVVIVRNSWGSRWGDNGYGYLPYTYLTRYGGDAWIVERGG